MGKALAEKVVALRWAIVAAWIAAAAALAVFVPAPDPAANELQTFLPQESPSVQASAALARHFPRSAGLSQAVIVIERRLGNGPDARATELTGADLDGLDGLARRLRESLPEAFAKVLPGSRLSVRSPGDFRLLARANPLVSADGASAIAVVHIPVAFTTIRSARVVEHIRRMSAETSFPEGLDVAVTGSAGFGADYAEATKRSHRNTLWVTLLAVTVILLAVYRAPLAAWTVLATISLAALVAHFGLHVAAHAGLHVGTAERIFVFVLLYGVGVDYSLLYLSRFREFLASSPQPAAAAAQALSATAPAILASSGTDIAGLAMLSAAAFEIFRTTGKVVPLALLVAAAATLTLVPAAAAIAGRRLFWPSRQVGHIGSRRFWPVLARVVTGRPGIVLAGAAILLAIPAARAVRLNFVYDTLTGLSAEYGAVRGREMARRHWPVGQASPTIVLLEAESGSGGKGLAALAEQLTEKLAQLEGVADVRSLQKPLGRAGEDIATELLLRAAAEQVRAEYLSGDARAARLEVVLTDPGFSNAAMATLRRVREGCAEALPSGVSAHFAGATAEMADIRAVTQKDFYRVAGLVLTVVFVIVLVLLRDAVLSAFMVGSVVLSYLAALGVSSWFFTGVCGAAGLDWKVEVFLFVVMLAVGVDYNIFLAARLAEESQRAGIREAARMAIVKTGGIISSAGLIMAATLGSLMAGEISLLVQLGFAFAVGMLLDTFIVRPLLLPAFAVVTGRGGRGMLPGGGNMPGDTRRPPAGAGARPAAGSLTERPGKGKLTPMRYTHAICLCALLAAGCKPPAAGVSRLPPVAQPTRVSATATAAAASPPASAGSDVMATINGRPIYMRELYAPLVEADGLRVAEMLIAGAVVAQEAARRNVGVTDEDITAENDRLLGGIFKGDIDDDQRERLLDQLLKSRGLTRSLWRGVLRRRTLLRKMVEPNVKITGEMVKAEHARLYGEKVQVSHIQLADVREAEKVIKQLEAGEDFAALAQKLSTNAQTARAGGRITPAFTRANTSVPQAIRDAAFALKTGQISGVVQVGNNFHVLKLHERMPPSEADYEKVKGRLGAELRERLIEQLRLELLSQLRSKANVEYINPALRRAAGKLLP